MTGARLALAWLCCLSSVAAQENKVVYFQNTWHCPQERRCGQWMGFTGVNAELYPKQDVANKGEWELIPAGEPDTYYIRNKWRCVTAGAPDSRCNLFLGFDGQNVDLGGRDSTPTTGDKGVWRLVPAPEKNTFYIENRWRCAYDGYDGRCGQWMGFSGQNVIIEATPSPMAWRMVSTTCDAVQVKGQWQYVFALAAPASRTISHGTSKRYTESKTSEWAASVTTEASAGIEVGGIGVSQKLSATISTKLAKSYSHEWASNTQVTMKYDFNQEWMRGKVVWQFIFSPEDTCDHIEETSIIEFAITPNRGIQPCCIPGYSTDNSKYEVCISKEVMIPGGLNQGCRVATKAELLEFEARKQNSTYETVVVPPSRSFAVTV